MARRQWSMPSRFTHRLSQWIQRLPGVLRAEAPPFGKALEAELRAPASLNEALEQALEVLGRAAVAEALQAEDGPAALVCVDLIKSLNGQLVEAAEHFAAIEQPWAQWTSARMKDFAIALTDDVVHTYLVNAVLSEAAVNSELTPIEVERIAPKQLTKRVTDILLRMRSTVFTRADLVQTLSTLGQAVSSRSRLVDA